MKNVTFYLLPKLEGVYVFLIRAIRKLYIELRCLFSYGMGQNLSATGNYYHKQVKELTVTDTYLKYSQSSFGKKICNLIGLPVPPVLKRATETPSVLVDEILLATDSEPIKAILKGHVSTKKSSNADRFGGLVFDATAIKTSEESKALYQFFHQHLKKVKNSGKIVVVGIEPKQCLTCQQATVQRGLIGFIKALAKEVGRKGVTANLIYSGASLNMNLASPLRFFLSYRCTYVNGQVVTLSDTEYLSEQDASWEKPLTGKVALVTGASRGIGASIAQVLARDGAKVIGLDIPQAQAELASLMAKIGGEAILADIADKDAPHLIGAEISKLSGTVDIVVHNAGITRDKMLVTMPESYWQQVMSVNLTSLERINEQFLEKQLINSGGRIVCVSSISGIAGNLGQTNYAMSKASVIGMIDSMSEHLSEQNITINAVAPGFIETKMTASIPTLTRFFGRRMCALSQGGLPVDVAETIAFFAAPQSQGISANLVRVCGLNIMGA